MDVDHAQPQMHERAHPGLFAFVVVVAVVVIGAACAAVVMASGLAVGWIGLVVAGLVAWVTAVLVLAGNELL